MGKVRLEKADFYPENVTISGGGLIFNSTNGYGSAISSLGIRKNIKEPAYLEVNLVKYSGISIAIESLGQSKNMFMVSFFPGLKMCEQTEFVNNVRSDEILPYFDFFSKNILGICMDSLNRKISLYVNGVLKKVFIAKRIDFSKTEQECVNFYIGVGGYIISASTFSVNFGASPFAYQIPMGCISYEKAVSYCDKQILYLKNDAVYGMQ